MNNKAKYQYGISSILPEGKEPLRGEEAIQALMDAGYTHILETIEDGVWMAKDNMRRTHDNLRVYRTSESPTMMMTSVPTIEVEDRSIQGDTVEQVTDQPEATDVQDTEVDGVVPENEPSTEEQVTPKKKSKKK